MKYCKNKKGRYKNVDDLCSGHGDCVKQATTKKKEKYSCVCDKGWGGINPDTSKPDEVAPKPCTATLPSLCL